MQACLDTNVKHVVALSTDKAAAPINLYGATKLCSDKLFIAANNIKGSRDLRFSVVRYGNVMGSRGSVIPFFLERQTDALPITFYYDHFNISLSEGVEMVLWTLKNLWVVMFVPKIPSYRIVDVAEAIGPGAKTYCWNSSWEKIHEEMITSSDSFTTIDWAVITELPSDGRVQKAYEDSGMNISPVPPGFSYDSGSNPDFLSVDSFAC